MFVHESLKFEELNTETIDGKRHYVTPNGKYPSITTALSILSRDAIMEWRKRVGEEVANKISGQAAGRGTRIHKMCEDYINNCLDIAKYTPLDKETFYSLKPVLDENIGIVYGQEVPLYSDYLGVAGRCDCIAEWNGKIAIIDFKTSKRPKTKDKISSYFMQASAYAVMFEERTGIPVNKTVIVMAVDGQKEPLVFEERRDNYIKECVEAICLYKSSLVSGL